MRRHLKRYLDSLSSVQTIIGYGLRTRLKQGYGRADLRADVMSGLVVGVVALPLSMALAIASGVPPQAGLYTAMIAGVVCALLGGTQAQITGPTAAFVVLLVPVVAKFGVAGLLVAGLLSGIMQIGMGLARLGRLMIFIPHPVTTGFTAGIAVVIGTSQLTDFFGIRGVAVTPLFSPEQMLNPHGFTLTHLVGDKGFSPPESYVERVRLLIEHAHTAVGWEVLIGVFTLGVLLLVPRLTKRVPAPLVGLTAAALLVVALGHLIPGFHVATIGSRFHSVVGGRTVNGIPPLPPLPLLPWHMPGPGGGHFVLSFETIRQLLPSAFGIAMLGTIESLLAAVVADGMAGTKHEPNAELIALGIGNILCPFFGGIPATGALARTATNINAGARSPFSAVIHSLFILACTVALAPLVAYLPMAALAALLLIVAKNMSEARHFVHLVRVAPRSDTIVLLTCFGMTVAFDMVLSVSVGVVLAALLFMRRMSDLTDIKLDSTPMPHFDLPPRVKVYEIGGPLFFGAAQKAMSLLDTVDRRGGTLVLYMEKVSVIDATGLVALETLLDRLKRSGHKVILAGVAPQPLETLRRAGIVKDPGRLAFAPDLDTALSMAILHSARTPEPAAAAS